MLSGPLGGDQRRLLEGLPGLVMKRRLPGEVINSTDWIGALEYPTQATTESDLPDGFKIRPARRGDREGIAELLKEFGHPDAADANTMFWVLNHPEIDVFIAANAMEHPVGFVSLSHRPQLRLRGRIATIDELVVARAWRGKHVGTQLIEAAVARAKALSAKRIELSTAAGESAQRGFWERNGFKAVDKAVLRYTSLER